MLLKKYIYLYLQLCLYYKFKNNIQLNCFHSISILIIHKFNYLFRLIETHNININNSIIEEFESEWVLNILRNLQKNTNNINNDLNYIFTNKIKLRSQILNIIINITQYEKLILLNNNILDLINFYYVYKLYFLTNINKKIYYIM